MKVLHSRAFPSSGIRNSSSAMVDPHICDEGAVWSECPLTIKGWFRLLSQLVGPNMWWRFYMKSVSWPTRLWWKSYMKSVPWLSISHLLSLVCGAGTGGWLDARFGLLVDKIWPFNILHASFQRKLYSFLSLSRLKECFFSIVWNFYGLGQQYYLLC